MSLIAFAVRLCLVRALKNQTLAGDDVHDNPVDPIALAVSAETPSIAVFTDTESFMPDGGRALLSGDRHQDIASHIFLPPTLRMTIDGQTVTFAGRRGGSAVVIDLIYRSMVRVLMTSEDPWAALWRRFVPRVTQVDHRAYVLQADKAGGGVRIPAREVMMRCSTIGEPGFGAEPSGIWADFIAALGTSPDTAPFVPLIRSAITGPTLAPPWLVERWYMGETVDEARSLAYDASDIAYLAGGPDAPLPVAGDPDLVPAQLAEVRLDRGDPEDRTVGDAYTISFGSTSSFGA